LSETKILYWYYREEQEIVYYNDEQDRAKREAFFEGLLDCIGFPLEKLYTYGEEEKYWRYEPDLAGLRVIIEQSAVQIPPPSR